MVVQYHRSHRTDRLRLYATQSLDTASRRPQGHDCPGNRRKRGFRIALGNVYTTLASSAGDPAIFERYFPLAVAAYSQAQSLDPNDSNAYLALARVYRLRADLTDPPDPTYIALAVNQLAGALQHGADDPAIAESVAQDFATFIARARLRGDFDTANAYLKRLEALAAQSKVPVESTTLSDERRQLAIDWTNAVLQDQGPGPARQVLAENSVLLS